MTVLQELKTWSFLVTVQSVVGPIALLLVDAVLGIVV
nr:MULTISPECIES: hypothetical protein [unclassified Bifidobacterium]